jgi:hypothetical protein
MRIQRMEDERRQRQSPELLGFRTGERGRMTAYAPRPRPHTPFDVGGPKPLVI